MKPDNYTKEILDRIRKQGRKGATYGEISASYQITTNVFQTALFKLLTSGKIFRSPEYRKGAVFCATSKFPEFTREQKALEYTQRVNKKTKGESSEQKILKTLLQIHTGENQPFTSKDVTEICGVNIVTVQKYIRTHKGKIAHGMLIKEVGRGHYIISLESEKPETQKETDYRFGYKKGHEDGYVKGRINGLEEGMKEGFKNGITKGFEKAKIEYEKKPA
jgi:hypothetical protein